MRVHVPGRVRSYTCIHTHTWVHVNRISTHARAHTHNLTQACKAFPPTLPRVAWTGPTGSRPATQTGRGPGGRGGPGRPAGGRALGVSPATGAPEDTCTGGKRTWQHCAFCFGKNVTKTRARCSPPARQAPRHFQVWPRSVFTASPGSGGSQPSPLLWGGGGGGPVPAPPANPQGSQREKLSLHFLSCPHCPGVCQGCSPTPIACRPAQGPPIPAKL